MDDEGVMFILEAIAYISASIAAFVYIWETCILKKMVLSEEQKPILSGSRSMSSMYSMNSD
tara:strand:- start:448 stop:630 length:183 start_codon:yes stop_codon:yes gene_type:complete